MGQEAGARILSDDAIGCKIRESYNASMQLNEALHRLAEDVAAPIDVAEVALRLAADEYSGLDVEGYLSELDCMAHDAQRYLRGDLAARLNGLCRYLFHEMGFQGNAADYYDPRNSYLNEVMDRRTGIPITLSVVAMAVANRAGMAVVGVGLPGHFVAKAMADGEEALFDPFHGGRRLTPQDCERLVEEVTGQPFRVGVGELRAAPAGLIVQRILNNLKAIHVRTEDFMRAVRVIERLRQLAPADSSLLRELGAAWIQAGQPGRAIDPLTAYLTDASAAPDASEVRQLLDRARGEIARWN
jgi:regulator of sirC expression with transglutaminase-like and TPR domain